MSGISEAGMRQLFSFNLSRTEKKLDSLLLSLKREKGASFFLMAFRVRCLLGLLILLWLAQETKEKKFVSPLSNQTLGK